MLVFEMIDALSLLPKNMPIVVRDGMTGGWSNVEIKVIDGTLNIFPEEYTGIFTSDKT